MPVVLNQIPNLLSDNLKESFKKNEKENYENNLTPTVKQVLTANIEYEEAPNHSNSTLNTLQAKYIVLKPNQLPLHQATNASLSSFAKVLKSSDNEKSNGTSSSSTSNSSSSASSLPKPKRELFDKSKIQIGWNPNGSGKYSHGQGFNNIGNTCYLNSALQAFLHVPAIAQWLLSDREDHREKCQKDSNYMCIICCMAQTLINSQRNNNSSTPSLITNRLHQICKHLTIGRQEDAHEFLRYLIEKMERAYLLRFKSEPWFKDLDQYSKETTPLNHILGGYLRSTVTCLSCNHESVTFQHFQDLPLDISKVNKLNEAIEGYFSRENLEECGYKCESCKKRVSASKKFSLERAPAVLCIQLKRFSALGGKITRPITITEKLSLEKYFSKSNDVSRNCHYRFVSMVQHLGSSSGGGHYTAVGMAPNNSFYCFDDSRVAYLTLDQALRANAYILFYELDKTSPKFENGHTRLQNGHSVVLQNGHTYSKNGIEVQTNGSYSNSMNLSKANSNEQSFSKPSLPRIIPSSVMKQQQQKHQKENNESSPSKNGVRSPGANGISNGENQRAVPLTSKLTNGQKRENTDQQQHSQYMKKIKLEPQQNGTSEHQQFPQKSSNLPSMPKINGEEEKVSEAKHSPPATTPPLIVPPKSLVPYDSDDDEDETASMKEARNKIHTASGVFLEVDSKENAKQGPSVQGSTIVTKALNEQHVKRGDDTMQQLHKLNHNGYGSSNVLSWDSQPSTMIKEVKKDHQQEDRKRQYEHEDDIDMDRGRVKKIKYNNSPPRVNEKYPNPFNEVQNAKNSNGHFERSSNHYSSQNGNYRPHNNYYPNSNIGYKTNYQKRNNFNNSGYKNNRHNNNNFKRHNYNNHHNHPQSFRSR